MEDFAQVADQRHVHMDVLVDLRPINLHVNFLGFLRIGVELAGHAVIEAHAQRNQKIGFLNGLIHPGFAVHAHHSQIQSMRSGKSAQPEQRQGHRNIGCFRQPADLFPSTGEHDAVSRQDHRALRFIDQRGRLIQFRGSGKEIGHLPVRPGRSRIPIEFAGTKLRVFGDVHEHGTRPVRSRDVEGFAQADGDFIRACHQIIVLGDGKSDAGDVRLLEGVASENRAAHLARNAHDGRRIHHRRGDSGDHIGRPGTRRRQRYTHPAARPRVSVGHVRGALFMPHQHMVDLRLGQGIVGRQNGAPGISEDVLDAEALQAFPDNLRAAELPWRCAMGRFLVHHLRTLLLLAYLS